MWICWTQVIKDTLFNSVHQANKSRSEASGPEPMIESWFWFILDVHLYNFFVMPSSLTAIGFTFNRWALNLVLHFAFFLVICISLLALHLTRTLSTRLLIFGIHAITELIINCILCSYKSPLNVLTKFYHYFLMFSFSLSVSM